MLIGKHVYHFVFFQRIIIIAVYEIIWNHSTTQSAVSPSVLQFHIPSTGLSRQQGSRVRLFFFANAGPLLAQACSMGGP